MISKPHLTHAKPGLAKGQVWKLKHAYIQILDLGKSFLRYRMLDWASQDGVRAQMSGVAVMRRYLKSRKARLVQDTSSI